jgi:hypothetical protein
MIRLVLLTALISIAAFVTFGRDTAGLRASRKLLFLATTFSGCMAVLFPELVQDVADFLGVGRGNRPAPLRRHHHGAQPGCLAIREQTTGGAARGHVGAVTGDPAGAVRGVAPNQPVSAGGVRVIRSHGAAAGASAWPRGPARHSHAEPAAPAIMKPSSNSPAVRRSRFQSSNHQSSRARL